MTKISDVENVVAIIRRFRLTRLKYMKANPRVLEEDFPASLSRESEALVIIKFIQTGVDMTEQFIGHHPQCTPPTDSGAME